MQDLSGLFLTRDGKWLHDGQDIRHRRLSLLLHQSICRTEDGALHVSTGLDSLPFQCEDAPYQILTLDRQNNTLRGRLSDQSDFQLPHEHTIWIDDAGRMRTPVKENQFWALLSRSATQSLYDRLTPTSDPTCFHIVDTNVSVKEAAVSYIWADKPPVPSPASK